MRPAALALASLTLTAGLLAAADTMRIDTAVDRENRDLENMQGRWMILRLQRDGQDDRTNETQTIAVKGDQFLVMSGKDRKDVYIFRVNPAKYPKTFDIFSSWPEKDAHEIAAIYRLDGDTLTLCWHDSTEKRPRTFAAKKGDGLTLLVLRREDR